MSEHACNDYRCPMHGGLKTRGAVKEGTVSNAKSAKTIVVDIPMLRKVSKYERFEKRRSKLHAHVPECLIGKVAVGTRVRIDECRKLSKTKAFVVTKVLD